MKEQKNRDTFQKKANTYLYDNKDDETIMNILKLYPEQQSFFFHGPEGEKKRQHLQAKLRNILNEMQGADQYQNAIGDRLRKRLRDLGRDARKKLGEVGQLIARASFVVPRGAALTLIRVNFRGLAKRFSLLNEQGKAALEKQWRKIGGKSDKLNDAIRAGKDKPIIVCGKKCRAKAGRNPQLSSQVKDDFVNMTGAEIAALVGAGGTVIGVLGTAVNNKNAYKNQQELAKLQADLQAKDAAENAIDATMTPQERALAEEIIKAQKNAVDPVLAIQNNANLTALEKEAALEALEKSTGSSSNNKKIIGGVLVALGLIGIAYFALSNKTSNT